MSRYYIPKTFWHHYSDMSTPSLIRAVEIVGGEDVRLELDCRTKSHKVVSFNYDQAKDIPTLRKALSSVLNNETISIYEFYN
jgi:hypothetical protein